MAKVDCKILSEKRCKDCSRKLKQNLVNRNPKAERCFRCHILAKEPHNRFKRLHIKVPPKDSAVAEAVVIPARVANTKVRPKRGIKLAGFTK